MTRWGEQTTNPLQRRDTQQSDARPRSVNQRVLRSDDSLFEYDDEALIPVGERILRTAIALNSGGADPSAPEEGELWIRDDTTPPELRTILGGTLYKIEWTAV